MRKLSWERPIYVQKLDLLPPWLDMILGRAINTVCLDCGHQCMCTRCGACMTFCPICMQVRYHTTNALISYWIPLCHPFNKYTRNEHFSKVLHGVFWGGGGGLISESLKIVFCCYSRCNSKYSKRHQGRPRSISRGKAHNTVITWTVLRGAQIRQIFRSHRNWKVVHLSYSEIAMDLMDVRAGYFRSGGAAVMLVSIQPWC